MNNPNAALEAQILEARRTGNQKELERLQAVYRSKAVYTRSGPVVQIVGGTTSTAPRQRSAEVPKPAPLLQHVAKPEWVTITPGAMARILSEAGDSRDGTETAGWLFGSRYRRDAHIIAAIGPGNSKRERLSMVLDVDHPTRYEAAFKNQNSDLVLVGLWHTHPRSIEPSDADRRCFEAYLKDIEADRSDGPPDFIGMIVTPGTGPNTGWDLPVVTPYLAGRDPLTKRVHVQTARLAEEG